MNDHDAWGDDSETPANVVESDAESLTPVSPTGEDSDYGGAHAAPPPAPYLPARRDADSLVLDPPPMQSPSEFQPTLLLDSPPRPHIGAPSVAHAPPAPDAPPAACDWLAEDYRAAIDALDAAHLLPAPDALLAACDQVAKEYQVANHAFLAAQARNASFDRLIAHARRAANDHICGLSFSESPPEWQTDSPASSCARITLMVSDPKSPLSSPSDSSSEDEHVTPSA